MKIKRNRSVLFLLPDYHSSFALRDALREQGWASEILISRGYDTRYLYSADVIQQWSPSKSSGRAGTTFNIIASFVQYMILSIRFKYHFHYSRLHFPATYESLLPPSLSTKAVHLAIGLVRRFGVVHVHVPSGCRDEATKEVFQQVEQGSVCRNCGFLEQCDDQENEFFLKRARRYSDFSIDSGFFESSELNTRPVRIKTIDTQRWKPKESRAHDRVVVLHSHALESRTMSERNIKGTPIINAVMNRICERHKHVEYRLVTGLTSRQMLAAQQDADIVIDQLYYGHWGSSGVEAMATGAVVVAYLRSEWMENFRRKFPEFEELVPVVSATADSLERVVESLILDEELRKRLSARGVDFVKSFYDPTSVACDLTRVLRDHSRT